MNTGSMQSPGCQLVPVVCAQEESGSEPVSPKSLSPLKHTWSKRSGCIMRVEVKKVAGYTVKYSKHCCTGNDFSKVNSKMN